jgi:serine/threonine-protein kinase HipA
MDFLASLIIFCLIGATDGHAKNFSVFLRLGGELKMTPLYNVLSVQGAVDRHKLSRRNFRLAMSTGNSRHYRFVEVWGGTLCTGHQRGAGADAYEVGIGWRAG